MKLFQTLLVTILPGKGEKEHQKFLSILRKDNYMALVNYLTPKLEAYYASKATAEAATNYAMAAVGIRHGKSEAFRSLSQKISCFTKSAPDNGERVLWYKKRPRRVKSCLIFVAQMGTAFHNTMTHSTKILT